MQSETLKRKPFESFNLCSDKKGGLTCLVLKGVNGRHKVALTDGKQKGAKEKMQFFATCWHSFQLASSTQHSDGRQIFFYLAHH